MFTGDIYIRGKYATYLKYLSQKTEKNDHKEKVAGIFERMIDVYMTAAIVGVNYGLRREDENASSDTVKIFADVVNREQDNLVSIFRIVMLVDNTTGLNADEKIATQVRVCNKEWRNIHREVIGALNHTFVDLDFFKRDIPTDNVSDMTYWPFWFRLGEEESVEDVAAVATKVIRNVYQWFLRPENYDRIMEKPAKAKRKSGRKKNTEVRTRYTLKVYDGVLKQFDEKTTSRQRVYKDDAARYFTTFLKILEDENIIAPYPLYEKCWVINDWENFEFAYLIQRFFEVSEIKVVLPDRIPWSLFTPIILSSQHEKIDEIRKGRDGDTTRVDGKIEDILDELMRRMKAEK